MSAPMTLLRLALFATVAAAIDRVARPEAYRRRPEPVFAPSPAVAPARARKRSAWIIVAGLLVTAALAATYYGVIAAKTAREARQSAILATGGDPDRAPDIIRANGCAGCHTIPRIAMATGAVGPRLDSVARNVYVGGVLPATPRNLVRWIRFAREVSPRTAMPNTGISEQEARDVAAFLLMVSSRP